MSVHLVIPIGLALGSRKMEKIENAVDGANLMNELTKKPDQWMDEFPSRHWWIGWKCRLASSSQCQNHLFSPFFFSPLHFYMHPLLLHHSFSALAAPPAVPLRSLPGTSFHSIVYPPPPAPSIPYGCVICCHCCFLNADKLLGEIAGCRKNNLLVNGGEKQMLIFF